MSKFYKYQFETKKSLKAALELLVLEEPTEEQPKPTLAYWSIVDLGVMYMTGKTAVDVLWKEDEAEGWEPFRINLGEFPSSHQYAGRSYSEDKDDTKIKKVKIKKGREDWKTKKEEINEN